MPPFVRCDRVFRLAVTNLLLASLVMVLAAPQALAAVELAPLVEVTTDSHGGAGVIRASVDIDAPPSRVWRLLIDCEAAPKMMVNLKICRVLDRDPSGHWDVRENISRGSFLPGIRTVIRADYDAPHVIRFHRVDGDLRVLEGEWRLEPTDGGAQTHLTYESRIAGPFGAPGIVIRSVLRHDMPITLSNLRRACEAQSDVTRP